MKRGSGILLHITSLPSSHGVGTLGQTAYDFIDFLKAAGQQYWQILPLGPTGYGDSPYQSFSTFAGNPYLIDLSLLVKEGALSESDLAGLSPSSDGVDYSDLFNSRFPILKKAYYHDKALLAKELADFQQKHAYWIESYAMYMALKFDLNQESLQNWDKPLRMRNPETISSVFLRLEDEIGFWVYLQYRFFEQWVALKTYANKNGVKIIGDIPIYVAEDSADVWAHHEILQLDEDRLPIKVAGCPPDYFAKKGQLWGNPVYDWEALREQNYDWWIARMRHAFSLYDMVRIDHFRAFSAFYTIPYGNEDAVIGEWMPGPGMDFFKVLKQELGEELPIIAEDLGFLDDEVRALLRDTGFPGMKVMQFGLTPGQNSEYLPHNFSKNSVAYLGTHDNDTLCGWFEKESKSVQEFACSYMRTTKENYPQGFLEALYASPADTVILTMQDLLQLGSDARMNTPSTMGKNWCWQMKSMDVLTDTLAEQLKKLCFIYSR